MAFVSTPLEGVMVVEIQRNTDERGFFARTFDHGEFRESGLNPDIRQCSVSFNHKRGTVRGMHWQVAPHTEVKLVRCTRGAIFDVVVDVRPDSKTFCQSFGIELSAENHRSLYIPEGFAHGFQTLEDNTEVYYQITPDYAPGYSCGARWDDPRFSIRFPLPITVISDRDRTFPDFVP